MQLLSASELSALPLTEQIAYNKALRAITQTYTIDKRFTTWTSNDKTDDKGNVTKKGTGKVYLQVKFKSGGRPVLMSRANVEEMIADAQLFINALDELSIT